MAIAYVDHSPPAGSFPAVALTTRLNTSVRDSSVPQLHWPNCCLVYHLPTMRYAVKPRVGCMRTLREVKGLTLLLAAMLDLAVKEAIVVTRCRYRAVISARGRVDSMLPLLQSCMNTHHTQTISPSNFNACFSSVTSMANEALW